jgi:hypothetical protein
MERAVSTNETVNIFPMWDASPQQGFGLTIITKSPTPIPDQHAQAVSRHRRRPYGEKAVMKCLAIALICSGIGLQVCWWLQLVIFRAAAKGE